MDAKQDRISVDPQLNAGTKLRLSDSTAIDTGLGNVMLHR
jgi:hypothetical protein